jgi:hypothetical protein
MGTVIPISLLGETLEAQSKLLAEGDDVDFFLMNRLKYRSKLSLSNAFRAEQADAVFMAIKQIERGGALILADQAGIGKGRSCAGVLRYAFCNGYLPVFITEKPNLFSDIYRDIRDIGGFGQKDGKDVVVNPFILNGFSSGGTEKDEFGNKIKKPSRTSIIDENGNEIITAPQKKEISDIIKSGKIPSEYNLILSTYSQLQGDDGTVRFKFLENLFESLDFKVILVLDECHNASGTKSDVGVKVRSMVASVSGCLFSSADCRVLNPSMRRCPFISETMPVVIETWRRDIISVTALRDSLNSVNLSFTSSCASAFIDDKRVTAFFLKLFFIGSMSLIRSVTKYRAVTSRSDFFAINIP